MLQYPENFSEQEREYRPGGAKQESSSGSKQEIRPLLLIQHKDLSQSILFKLDFLLFTSLIEFLYTINNDYIHLE